jgi:FMN phosphatase YigB (HAD superfamily)
VSIKVVSFDVWNTLVKANELYRYNRAVLLAQAVGARPSAIEDDFVAGNLMRAMLASVGIYQYVDFGLFSDEIEATLPSPRIFAYLQQISESDISEVLHIGNGPKINYQRRTLGVPTLLYPSGGKATTQDTLQYLADLPSHPVLTE